MRTCRVCEESKPDEDFNKGRNECRECQKKLQKSRYWAKKGQVADVVEKTCSTCGFILPISKFDTQCGTRDGYRTVCRDCCNKRRKEWRYRTSEDYSQKHLYFDKGIQVCNEWQKYKPFAEWSKSNGYKEGLQIDRRDNSKGYNPDNCRWISSKENSNNRDAKGCYRKRTYARTARSVVRCYNASCVKVGERRHA